MLIRFWLLKPTAAIFSPITRLILNWLMIPPFPITIVEFFYGHSTRSGRIMKPMTQRRSFMPRTSHSFPKNLILASNAGGDGWRIVLGRCMSHLRVAGKEAVGVKAKI